MRRTAQFIEEQKAASFAEPSDKKPDGRGRNPNSRKNLKPWPKGVSGNPGGLPGTDLGAKYAREFFERHDGIESMSKDLKGFNAYAFGVLADRAYGKVKDVQEITGADGAPLSLKVEFVKPKRS